MIYKRADDLEGVKTFKKGDEVHFWCGPYGWKAETVSIPIMESCSGRVPCLILGIDESEHSGTPGSDDSLFNALEFAFPGRRFHGKWPNGGTPESLVDTCRWLMQHAEAKWGKPPVEKDTGRPRVGDLVRVVHTGTHPLAIGDVCKILTEDKSSLPFECERVCDHRGPYWFREDHVELIQRCSEPEPDDAKPSAPYGFERTWAMMWKTGNTEMIATLLSELLPLVERADRGGINEMVLGDTIRAFTGLAEKS